MFELLFVFVFFDGSGGGGSGGGCDGGSSGRKRKMRAIMCERFFVYQATQLDNVALGCFVIIGEMRRHLYRIGVMCLDYFVSSMYS